MVSALEEGTNGDDPAHVLLKRIPDAFAEYERLVIKFRTRAALKAKKAKAEPVGNAPFGFRWKDGKLVPDTREQKIIEGIGIMGDKGVSIRGMVRELKRHGVVGRTGKPLGVGQVGALLVRRSLAGGREPRGVLALGDGACDSGHRQRGSYDTRESGRCSQNRSKP